MFDREILRRYLNFRLTCSKMMVLRLRNIEEVQI